jgi:hypothetical protein
LNLFQTWFKLMITFRISVRLHDLNTGVLEPVVYLLEGSNKLWAASDSKCLFRALKC